VKFGARSRNDAKIVLPSWRPTAERRTLVSLRSILGLALAVGSAATAIAAPTTWTIDPNHSAAHFTVRHLMVSNVRGEFGGVHGTVVFDDAEPSKGAIEATIDATTINTRVEGRDKDLKGPSFFEVDKYPTITFKSTAVRPAGDDKFSVDGDLTIHGVTHPVTLSVDATPAVKDPRGNERRGAEATTKLSRKAFGVNGTPTMVGDEVQITIDIEAVHKAGS
jgi:polyisoprenoid-binding protein YceI